MTRTHSNPPAWLLGTALLAACGGGAEGSGSLSGGTEITTVTATDPGTADTGEQPPTTGGGTMNVSGEAESHSGSSTGDGTGSSGTAETGSSGETGSSSGDGPSDPSGSSSGGSTSPVGPMPCQVEQTPIAPIPPDVLLLLDKSGSMSMPDFLWDHDENPQTPKVTRWSTLHEVVEAVVTKFDKTVNFGAKLYPKLDATPFENAGACDVDPGVEVPIAAMNAAGVLAGIPGGDVEVLGGTPMEGGVKEAFKYIDTLDPTDQRFVLMIADGDISKTCDGENFYEALATVTAAYEDDGVATYVVGIAIDDPISKQQLTDVALAGGKPNPNGPDPFYQTKNQADLEDALQQIVADTISCVVAVDPEPSEPDLFEVWVDDAQIPSAQSCAGDDGWVWTQPHKEIELCGAACDQLKQSAQIEVRYYCMAG